ncbi:hypothetical protein [Corynebacterium riegelii]|uniref:hypothetical protein n=1 Tax=Corynebacterium riegelii TaxID=156976 RepID=UPI00288A67A1|nr:hypothetical protein [Corynebacterium riegelii]
MRKFQKAALAGATAVAVAFGSTAVATAAEEKTNESSTQTQSGSSNKTESDKKFEAPTKPTTGDKDKTPSSSTKIGGKLGAHKDGQAIGTDYNTFFGKNENWGEQAPIYKLLFVGGIATFVSALVGLVFGPAYNFFVHGPSF